MKKENAGADRGLPGVAIGASEEEGARARFDEGAAVAGQSGRQSDGLAVGVEFISLGTDEFEARRVVGGVAGGELEDPAPEADRPSRPERATAG